MNRLFIGKTESGKTYLAKKLMLESSKGALFINYVDPEKDMRFEQVNEKTPFELIINLLKNGRKVQFNINPNANFDNSVKGLYRVFRNIKNIIFCVDEIHLLDNKTKKELAKLWKTGRHNNIDAYGITQRPQDLDRGMTSQSKYLHIFKMSMENSYFKNYNIDLDLIPKVEREYHTLEM